METYIRQRQLIMSPLMPSRVIVENEPLVAVFNKVIATREVNHKGQGTDCQKIYRVDNSGLIDVRVIAVLLIFLYYFNFSLILTYFLMCILLYIFCILLCIF